VKMGPNMRAFLNSIEAEPGEWTAKKLANDFGVSAASARRTLRTMESHRLVRKTPGPIPKRGGRRSFHYFPGRKASGDTR